MSVPVKIKLVRIEPNYAGNAGRQEVGKHTGRVGRKDRQPGGDLCGRSGDRTRPTRPAAAAPDEKKE